MAALLTGGVLASTPPAGDAKYHGVDIYRGDSSNGQINWPLLAASQDFAYIKSGEGVDYTDPMFGENVAAAKAHGLAWGPYHFMRMRGVAHAQEQARQFWARIKGTGFTLIPALDVESYDDEDTAPGIREDVQAFVDTFRALSDITPVIYTYTSYANDVLRGQFADCPLWLADYRGYAGDVVGWGVWQAWQYSEHGSIDAIANDEVDLDHATAGIWMDQAQAGAATVDQTTAVPTSSPAPVFRGDPAVLALQQRLNRLGIPRPALVEDGVSGPKTRGAVRTLEQVAGIDVDSGIFGPQCERVASAIEARPTLQYGDRGQAARYLQYRLGIAVDGIFGHDTDVAARAYQSAHGLDADGIVGPVTWHSLIGG